MERREAEELIELRFLEQELDVAYRRVIELVGGDEVGGELRRFRADHERQAARVDDLMARVPAFERPEQLSDDATTEVLSVTTPVESVMDLQDALASLADAERAAVERYEQLLAAMPEPATEMLARTHLDIERQHQHFLERRVPAGAGGSRRP